MRIFSLMLISTNLQESVRNKSTLFQPESADSTKDFSLQNQKSAKPMKHRNISKHSYLHPKPGKKNQPFPYSGVPDFNQEKKSDDLKKY